MKMEYQPEDGILTVRELRSVLKAMPDDTQVVVATDSWYLNIRAIATPDDKCFCAVTFFTADNYDPRQH
jgi:hypothetical protein